MRWHTFHGNAVQIKKTLCNDIVKNWHSLKALVDKSNFNVTVPLMYFEKELHVTKKKPSNLKQSRKMLIWNFWQHSLINCCRKQFTTEICYIITEKQSNHLQMHWMLYIWILTLSRIYLFLLNTNLNCNSGPRSKSPFIQVLSKSMAQRVIIPIFHTPNYITKFLKES